MTPEQVTLPLAFAAGLLSFLSPCVLPLVPAYLGYLGGTAVLGRAPEEARGSTRTLVLHALLFVLGFSAVFVLLGASATLLGRILFDYRTVMARVGGVLLLVFGLRLMGEGWSRKWWAVAAGSVALVTFLADSGWIVDGAMHWEGSRQWLGDALVLALATLAGAGWAPPVQLALAGCVTVAALLASPSELAPRVVESLSVGVAALLACRADLLASTRRMELAPSDGRGLGRSALFGVAFAAGWTPCLGPILALILGLASQLDTVGRGVLLLAAYSMGLGIPFLVAGLLLGPVGPRLRRLNRYAGAVSLISGVLLALMGILFFTDSLAFLAQYGSLLGLES